MLGVRTMTDVDPSCALPRRNPTSSLGRTFEYLEDIAGLWNIFPDYALSILIITLIVALVSSTIFFCLALVYWSAQYQLRRRWGRWWAKAVVATFNWLDLIQDRLIVLYNDATFTLYGEEWYSYRVWVRVLRAKCFVY